ncbi:Sensory box/GGDEF domain protein [Pediococcus damnosus]|uniref:Sensory box/GGDEF domain protein n=1 Tax=Pediococcus damnosus TaxID=51663 RepID=A0ABM6A3Y4_9LACO|nr:GGDEF domain-containing protein [Pediococcus damnosus]AMV60447.1 Sensory box/GGDEF domain protein [Pediococcus damnosus]AMV64698.1 Sensory box/GGDEF domain protein [Pediococcus damnosus]AMV66955.1 Sensory box/GGDEF domain protein [Pediococcus damnosus]AMV69445.1 Sensory box/GGDEF domain protein [Pediococcus damnosus]KJU73641.1 diguanylate cyclase [Pediococcus damnosus LMG 28219]
MTQHEWLLSPLFTGIFVTLGIILFFQLITRSMITHSRTEEKPINYLVGRLSILSVVYFSILGVYFEYAAAHTKQDVAFVDFRLLLLFYVIIYLGQRTSLIVILSSFIARAAFWGLTMGTLYFVLTTVLIYLFVSVIVYIVRYFHLNQLILIGLLDIVVGVFWIVFHFIRFRYFNDVTVSSSWYYWMAFIIMNFSLYYGLTRLNNENDYLTSLTHQASTDPLTKLKNYSVFKKDFNEEFHAFKNVDQPLTMIAFDIDHFKRVNDQHGHLAGNAVLKAVSHLVAEKTKTIPQAKCYRVGGEEFNILLPDVTLEQAAKFSYQLQSEIRETTFKINENKAIQVTISMGVSTLQKSDVTQNLLYERTDQMLYHSKGKGRDCVTVSKPETSDPKSLYGQEKFSNKI